MNEDKDLLRKYGREAPYSTPEGYFDDFTARLLERLPEVEAAPEPRVTRWSRVKPWVYMAAMFCGLMLSVRMLVGTGGGDSDMTGETISGYTVEELDAIMDKTMMDDYTLYQYLTEADFDID